MRRIAPALCLFFFAPLTAEYLIGYDDSTGNFGAMLAGLIIFGPLYGGPALIIREVARRAGRGWPTMILLALGFGLVQAGLIDHSLFSISDSRIPSWQDDLVPTYIPGLGISANNALNFISGHAIWSICVPIAIVETFVPYRRTTPWLGKLGLAIALVLYLLASALIFVDAVEQEQFLPSATQLIGTAIVVVVLICVAFALTTGTRAPFETLAPTPWLVGAFALAGLSLPFSIEVVFAYTGVTQDFTNTWWGVSLSIVLIAVLGILIARWSKRKGWGAAHHLALAGGALLTRVWLAFFVKPIGDVSMRDKLIHNMFFAIGVAVLLVMAARTGEVDQNRQLAEASH